LKIRITAAIKDDILDTSLLAVYLLELLRDKYPNAIQERYKFDPKDMTGVQMLEECGKRRGCLVHGGEVDYQRASTVVLDDFRNGRLGKITLDHEVEEAGEETSD
jgi:ribosome biogenesis GTPase A